MSNYHKLLPLVGQWRRQPVDHPGRLSFEQLLEVAPDGRVLVLSVVWDQGGPVTAPARSRTHSVHYGRHWHQLGGEFLDPDYQVTESEVRAALSQVHTRFVGELNAYLGGEIESG